MVWEDGFFFVIEISLIFNYNFLVILYFDVYILFYNLKKCYLVVICCVINYICFGKVF